MVGHSRWTGEQAEFVQHSRGLPAQGVSGTSDNERLLGSFLAVGVHHDQNKERTKARQEERTCTSFAPTLKNMTFNLIKEDLSLIHI